MVLCPRHQSVIVPTMFAICRFALLDNQCFVLLLLLTALCCLAPDSSVDVCVCPLVPLSNLALLSQHLSVLGEVSTQFWQADVADAERFLVDPDTLAVHAASLCNRAGSTVWMGISDVLVKLLPRCEAIVMKAL